LKQSKYRVLIVDGDKEFVSEVKELLERNGYNVITANTGQDALEIAEKSPDIKLALLDLMMPMMEGFTLLLKLKEIADDITVIIVSGYGTIDSAVDAIKRGASDFIPKPFDKYVLLKKLEVLRKKHELEVKVGELKKLVSDRFGFDNIISGSTAMKKVFQKARAAASSDAPVFIIGQTGTGKELLAKAIHDKGKRSEEPFIAVNCGAIPK